MAQRNDFAYQAGRQWSALPSWGKIAIGLIAALLLARCMMISPSDAARTTSAPAGLPEVQIDAARVAEKLQANQKACKRDLPAKEAEFAALTAAGRLLDARDELLPCGRLLKDESLIARAKEAEVAHYVGMVNDVKDTPQGRLAMLNELVKVSPENAGRFAALRTKLEDSVAKMKAAEVRVELANIRAKKKKEGVRLGMTAQDVLDSSWGKPQDVNTTITARGRRDQWVYGMRRYLYLQDGILVAIQE